MWHHMGYLLSAIPRWCFSYKLLWRELTWRSEENRNYPACVRMYTGLRRRKKNIRPPVPCLNKKEKKNQFLNHLVTYQAEQEGLFCLNNWRIRLVSKFPKSMTEIPFLDLLYHFFLITHFDAVLCVFTTLKLFFPKISPHILCWT